jgi:hypothetical protein
MSHALDPSGERHEGLGNKLLPNPRFKDAGQNAAALLPPAEHLDHPFEPFAPAAGRVSSDPRKAIL